MRYLQAIFAPTAAPVNSHLRLFALLLLA